MLLKSLNILQQGILNRDKIYQDLTDRKYHLKPPKNQEQAQHNKLAKQS